MKRVFFILVFVLLFKVAFAQSPMSFYTGDGQWTETSSYCIVDGMRLHYWLFSSQRDGSHSTRNGSIVVADDANLHSAGISYAESLGWTRDYTKSPGGLSPNPSLAVSVKNMMREHNAIISMTIVVHEPKSATLVINSYSWGLEGTVSINSPLLAWSDFYPLIR